MGFLLVRWEFGLALERYSFEDLVHKEEERANPYQGNLYFPRFLNIRS